MRKIMGLAVSCLVACSFFLMVQPVFGASVLYDQQWEPTDTAKLSSLTINFTGSVGYSFGIYDWKFDGVNSDSYKVLHQNSASPGIAYLDFGTNSDTSKYLDISISGTTQRLELGDSWEVGFYFSDAVDSDTSRNTLYEYEQNPNSSTNYFLYGTVGGTTEPVYQIDLHDLKPSIDPDTNVPIPTAMVLLSSGLIGLAGFKRKMDN